jgi:hypothetical protein
MRENDKIVRYKSSVSAKGDSPYWSLLKYYQQLECLESRQLILEAAAAFWLPLVAKEGEMKGEALRCLVTDCLYRLRRQEREITCQFRLLEEAATVEPLFVSPTRETVSFAFVYRVSDAGKVPLVRYLMDSQRSFTLPQKVLWSSQAFWGAIAEREVGQANAEQLSRIATYCIGCLREHIDYLKNYFEYREIADGTTVNAPSNPTVLTTSSPPLEDEATEGNTEVMSEEEMEQWLRHDPKNDDWRSNLFN